MIEKQKPTKGAEPIPEFHRTDDFRSIYTNNIQFAVSTFDVRITFGESFNTGSSVSVEQSVSIVMSLQQAKVLATMLAKNVELYEREVGTVPVPDEMFR